MAQREPLQVEVSFEQAAQFRTIHVDGAWGGVTPGGGIAVNVYNEHSPLPSSQTVILTGGGKTSPKPTGETGIVRVIETELRMTPDVARSIATWLAGKADDADRLAVAARADQEAAGSSDSSGPAS